MVRKYFQMTLFLLVICLFFRIISANHGREFLNYLVHLFGLGT